MSALHFANDFSALRTRFSDGRASSSIEKLRVDDLSAGEVLLRTRYAGVNYKDCLAVTGRAKVMTSFPRVGGIELVGDVLHSESPDFRTGQTVLLHGFRTGVEFDGGFSEVARVPASHLMPLPTTLSAYETAVIGLPGFTAAMALEGFEQRGIRPESGQIAVSGAFGAVGMLALSMLSAAGYQPVALTRRADQRELLCKLGAVDVIDISEVAGSGKPLEKERFAAAIDNVGGAVLSWLLKSLRESGCVASVGNASGNTFEGNVLPFIIRNVQIFGIVANADWETRRRLWGKLSSAWKPDLDALAPFVNLIELGALLPHCALQLDGKAKGRTLVAYPDERQER